MIKRRLPIIVVDSKIVLPAGRFGCLINEAEDKASINLAKQSYNNEVAILFKKDSSNAESDSTFDVGILGQINKITDKSDGTVNIELELLSRLKLLNTIIDNNVKIAEVELEDVETPVTEEQLALYKEIKTNILICGQVLLKNPDIILQLLNKNAEPRFVCDVIVDDLVESAFSKYDFLTTLDFTARLKNLLDYLTDFVEVDNLITEKVAKELNKEQKEYYLRKKIRIIQEELGDAESGSKDSEELREKIKAAGMPETVEKQVLKELRRYQATSSASPDSTMIRAYLDLMIDLPWTEETKDNVDIAVAKAKLDETHFGLEKVKDRILEYLGVKLYTGKNPQTILCLAGAPGVGKTTLARSIAEALGRKFVKQSMGGVKDEAEVRGHRRTYLGALPGRIINGIKEAGVKNPVFLLDEIDKIGSDYKGDPSAALLEVLDPAQNKHFMDHYTEVEYDLSNVMFICTANYLENVPVPLKDRMEIIELSSYTELEKFQIAKNYVVKRSLDKNGLEPEKFEITDDAIRYLIKYYTREAGARQLERCMDSLVRKAIKKILSDKVDKVVVTEEVITEMLGKKLYDFNDSVKEDLVGTVTGLAYTQAGGDTLQIECTTYKGKGTIQLTGKLGDVMKESAQAAYSWVKSHADDYNIDYSKFEDLDVHIHVPEGATPKDGPSAGVTMTTALVSALSNRPVHHELGMTGEITLRGKVLPIGGLKEKSIAAYRNGLTKILIPQDNVKDLEDIPQEVKDHLEIVPVATIKDVLNIALI